MVSLTAAGKMNERFGKNRKAKKPQSLSQYNDFGVYSETPHNGHPENKESFHQGTIANNRYFSVGSTRDSKFNAVSIRSDENKLTTAHINVCMSRHTLIKVF